MCRTPSMDSTNCSVSTKQASNKDQTDNTGTISPNNEQIKSFEDEANFFSKITLSFLNQILKLGGTQVLERSDLRVPSHQDQSSTVYEKITTTWNSEIEKSRLHNQEMIRKTGELTKPKKPSLIKALFHAASPKHFFLALVLYGLSTILQFVPVLILNDLVKYLGGSTTTSTFIHPWVEVFLLFIIPVCVSLLQNNSQVLMMHISVFSRASISSLLYNKSLRVSPSGRALTSTGQVVNLMSNDSNQIQMFFNFVSYSVFAPLQIVISIILIFQQVGNATWVGLALMAAFVPLNTLIFSLLGKYRRKTLVYTDKRVKLMNEIMNGIRIIKFYAWEKPFHQEVDKYRNGELKNLTKVAYVTAVGFSLILLSVPIIQPVIVFLTYSRISSVPLDAAKAFTTISLFNMMRFPMAFLPMGLLQYIQAKISIQRIEMYLLLPDLKPYVEEQVPEEITDEKSRECGSITIQNGSFSWIDDDAVGKFTSAVAEPKNAKRSILKKTLDDSSSNGRKRMTLQDINVTIEAGSLVAVVGSVGSGKSSLLSAILGEMEPSSKNTHVYVPRESYMPKGDFVSYCSQTPWIVNDTLRGNILFGRAFHKSRYEEVITASALIDDFHMLPAGDMTEIGERGINLSGGQKARISLARALYSTDTKLLLLDDPLSAVDAHVGEHLFTKALTGDVVKDVTRVLVTHHVHRLRYCDKVIVMEDGRIKDHGTYDELCDRGIDFMGAMDISKVTEDADNGEDKVRDEKEKDDSTRTVESSISSETNAVESSTDETDTAPSDNQEDESTNDKKGTNLPSHHKATTKADGKTLVTKEERSEGSVSFNTYVLYAKSGGLYLFISIFIIQAFGRGSEVASTFWLSYWASASVSQEKQGNELTSEQNRYFINIYALFSMIGVIGLTVRSLVMAIHRMRASRTIHQNLTTSILRAPVSFFDVTPIGRILNRFAADMDKIDLELTSTFSQIINTVYQVLGALAGILAGTKGTFIVPLIPMSVIYYKLQKWFRKTSTELQRITNIANSPLFTDFSQVLSGTSTIRAYRNEDRFFAHFQESFDTMNTAYVLNQLVSYWLSIRLDILGGIIGALVGGLSVATAPYGFIPAGWLGISLSNSIDITNFLKHGVRMIAALEAQMNSVERIMHYTENVAPEAPDVLSTDPDTKQWPSGGEITMSKASMRYRDGPLVLKDISLKIEAGEKIGVVGRTGSGKSSLMILLFRICEIEENGGFVSIDDVNTRLIGLDVLRHNLSIIPQDPIMFSNTIRYNIDPFRIATDDEIWIILEKVQLSAVVAELPKGLDEWVAEGGENFSQGQRQLLCIARVLLRKPKILIMDEATSSIDNETDVIIQKMIRENFMNSTVLTIAHRLNTIMDCDRVLVLDSGEIREFDTVDTLLQKEEGAFRSMVDKHNMANKGNGVEL